MQYRIPDEIKAVIFQSTEPWLSDLSELLAGIAWKKLSPFGIAPDNYGTHRCLERDPATDLQSHFTLRLDDKLLCQLEILPEKSRSIFKEAGLIFAPCSLNKDDVPNLQSALSLIGTIPTLYSTVALFLRSLHVLKASNEEYDVSHSDPSVPFSIFVTIPSAERYGRLRLAESIVHECMHLQLTVFEELFPLVEDQNKVAYSPWRQTMRPLAGVIHGLYVFTVINTWLKILTRSNLLEPWERNFVEKRQEEITRETTQVMTLASEPGITDAGRDLTCYLFRCLAR